MVRVADTRPEAAVNLLNYGIYSLARKQTGDDFCLLLSPCSKYHYGIAGVARPGLVFHWHSFRCPAFAILLGVRSLPRSPDSRQILSSGCPLSHRLFVRQ